MVSIDDDSADGMSRAKRKTSMLGLSDYRRMTLDLAAARGSWHAASGWCFAERFSSAMGVIFGTLFGCVLWMVLGLAGVLLF